MLRRIVYLSRSIGGTGLSTVSLAHVLGAGERNNRRDQVTSGMVVHGDRILQALEGPLNEVGRTLARIQCDPRHTDVRVLIDAAAERRLMSEPLALCHDPEAFLRAVSLPCLSLVTAEVAGEFVERRLAA